MKTKLILLALIAVALALPFAAYGLINDTEALFTATGKVTDRYMAKADDGSPMPVITKQDANLMVTDYFEQGFSVGETYRKPDNSPFTIWDIKVLAKAYAPIEEWKFFGKWGHIADLILRNDKSGRVWIRLNYGEGNPGHPYVVTFELTYGSPNQ